MAAYKAEMDFAGWIPFLREKCAARNVTFTGVEDFFPPSMLIFVEKTWHQWLGPLVPRLPSFDTVAGELRPEIAALFSQEA